MGNASALLPPGSGIFDGLVRSKNTPEAANSTGGVSVPCVTKMLSLFPSGIMPPITGMSFEGSIFCRGVMSICLSSTMMMEAEGVRVIVWLW